MEYNEHMLISGILNDMSDGILVIGFDGIIRLHNHAAEQGKLDKEILHSFYESRAWERPEKQS